MSFSLIKILILPIILLIASDVFAQKIEIVRGAEMRVAGKYDFPARIEKTDAQKIV